MPVCEYASNLTDVYDFNMQDSLMCHARTFMESLSQTTQQLVLLLDDMLISDEVVPPGKSSASFRYLSCRKGKGKVFPYSLPSVEPGADPGLSLIHI